MFIIECVLIVRSRKNSLMSKKLNFEFFEHTADIGIRVYGETLTDLFNNSAQALFQIILDYQPKSKIEKKVELKADSFEDLLVIWLNELISGLFADKFLPAKFNIVIEDNRQEKIIKADMVGENFSPYENKINMEIKAATYHNLKIQRTCEGYKAEIIFDV